jgi:antitoxin MazE
MNLHVAKWGNSLALRIPAEVVRSIGLKEGDSLEASLTPDGGLTIHAAAWSRTAFASELSTAREAMPLGQSVMDEVRRGGRY